MVRPLKYALPQYRQIEDRIWNVICEKFDLCPEMPPEIKVADNRALMTERRDVMVHTDHVWSLAKDFPPFPETSLMYERHPSNPEQEFMAAFLKYRSERKLQAD